VTGKTAAVKKERRASPRIRRPFEGSWSGASGATRCRIGDISLGGCFVESLATPVVGEATTVTVTFGDEHSMSFSGTVLYIEKSMGFAVKFNPLSGRDRALFEKFLDLLRA
jgi:hypothetical protein